MNLNHLYWPYHILKNAHDVEAFVLVPTDYINKKILEEISLGMKYWWQSRNLLYTS